MQAVKLPAVLFKVFIFSIWYPVIATRTNVLGSFKLTYFTMHAYYSAKKVVTGIASTMCCKVSIYVGSIINSMTDFWRCSWGDYDLQTCSLIATILLPYCFHIATILLLKKSLPDYLPDYLPFLIDSYFPGVLSITAYL